MCNHYLCLPMPWAECCSIATPGRSVERSGTVCSKHLPTQGHPVQGSLSKFSGPHSWNCESRSRINLCLPTKTVIDGGVQYIIMPGQNCPLATHHSLQIGGRSGGGMPDFTCGPPALTLLGNCNSRRSAARGLVLCRQSQCR